MVFGTLYSGVWDAGLVHSVGGCMWCLGRRTSA